MRRVGESEEVAAPPQTCVVKAERDGVGLKDSGFILSPDVICLSLERSPRPRGGERRKDLPPHPALLCNSGDFCCQILLVSPPAGLV